MFPIACTTAPSSTTYLELFVDFRLGVKEHLSRILSRADEN